MTEDRKVAIACAVFAVVIGGVAVLFAIAPKAFHISALVRMDPREPLAETAQEADSNFQFILDGHYDGVYAYAISLDPLAWAEAHKQIDYPAYRYGRIGYGWLGAIFSLGYAPLVPYVLLAISLVSLGLGTYGVGRLAHEFGWSPTVGLLVPLNPGIIIGLTVLTSEPLTIALGAFALLFWLRGRHVASMVLLMFLGLVKEPFLAFAAGLFLWELIAARRQGSGMTKELKRKLLLLALVPLPLLAWWLYVHQVFGEWSFNQPWLVSAPVLGYLDGLHRVGELGAVGNFEQMQIGVAGLPLLLCVSVGFLIGFVCAIRMRSPLDCVFIFLMLVFCLLSWWQLVYAKDMLRILAIPITLLPAVLIHHVYKPREREPELAA